MKLRRMGLEWGAAYDAAQPLLITSDFHPHTQILVYERENGGLTVEIPVGCHLNVYESTMTENKNRGKGERVLTIETQNGFEYVPKPRK